ncbi:MAG: hypothetical protein JEZ00_14145 [Anaerolineaceae bacterium]|nr:hypothetical protein [Anaerolineaceae bacterium]
MSEAYKPVDDQNEFELYEIRIKGHLDARWSDWFGDLVITLEKGGITCLTVRVIDQAALYGYLRKVRDLGMLLLSVICVKPDQADTSDVNR